MLIQIRPQRAINSYCSVIPFVYAHSSESSLSSTLFMKTASLTDFVHEKVRPVHSAFLSVPALTCASSASAQDAPQLRISTGTTSVAAGRTVSITARGTKNGQPLVGALLFPYVNGQRFGDPVVTNRQGRAVACLPIFDTKIAKVQFDLIEKNAEGKWIPNENVTGPDRWIWAGQVRDNQDVWMQKTFNLAATPARGSLFLAVDDNAHFFINGQDIGASKGWENVKPVDVTRFLHAGENVLSVLAHNGGGRASLAARLEADKSVVVSDASWNVWESVPPNWPAKSSGSASAHVLGSLTDYGLTPSPWPSLNYREKFRDDGLLTPSPTVSNALNIRVTAPDKAPDAPLWDTYCDTWVATDGLGRSLPTFEEVGAPRPDKKVGLFYYIWHSHHSRIALRLGQPIYNASEALLANPSNPEFARATNWWHEPLFGYYNASDRWVLRKHAQMLADAGVDTLIYDTSNETAYWPEWLNHADLLESMRQNGQKTPDLAHLFWDASLPGIWPDLSNRFYGAGLYRDLWFNWKGKPLVLADPLKVSPSLADKFSLRASWAWSNTGGWFGDGKDKWPWLDDAPQNYGWHDSPGKPEQLVVSAGHHATSNKGRSMVGGVEPDKASQHPDQGIQFAEQWKRVPQVDPEFLFITQWNEWIAGAYGAEREGQAFDGRTLTKNDSYFIDEYNSEFSRDLEPTKADASGGGVADNYYYQMVAGIRRFKGVRPLAPMARKSLRMDGDFSSWKGVVPEFRDTLGDTAHRDAWSWGWNKHYSDTTGRNDIRSAKTAFDTQNFYFYVRTQNKLSPPVAGDWMTLFLDSDNNASTGWMGYDFRVRGLELQIYSGNGWTKVLTVERKVGERELELAIPLRALFAGTSRPRAVDFKWTDNCENDKTWRDFSLHGDAAPNDRFNFRAKFASPCREGD